LFFFTFEDGCGVTWKVFDSVDGEIATRMRRRIRGVWAFSRRHLEVDFVWILKRRGGLALKKGRGRHDEGKGIRRRWGSLWGGRNLRTFYRDRGQLNPIIDVLLGLPDSIL
jgi:hypothetical protein